MTLNCSCIFLNPLKYLHLSLSNSTLLWSTLMGINFSARLRVTSLATLVNSLSASSQVEKTRWRAVMCVFSKVAYGSEGRCREERTRRSVTERSDEMDETRGRARRIG